MSSSSDSSAFWASVEKFKKEHPARWERLNAFQKLATVSKPITKDLLPLLEDRRSAASVDINALLHGPTSGDPAAAFDCIAAHSSSKRDGIPQRDWSRWQEEAAVKDKHYAGDPAGVNLCVPDIVLAGRGLPYIDNTVVLSHPEDCERVARMHVKKNPNFNTILYGSVISTLDNAHWKTQRAHLSPVFLPKASLQEIFPITSRRAAKCAKRLEGLHAAAGEYGVQMNEFFLYEAMAQLQLGLMGLDEEFMDSTNVEIRKVFSGDQIEDLTYGRDVVVKMMAKVGANPAFAVACDEDVIVHGKPVFGPLSKSVADAGRELDMQFMDQWGNMMIILFAGHDTTAHTMTWLTYEMSRNPHYQARLHAEVDALFDKMAREGREEMVYSDCEELPFMTRCIMETLRLWMAVPNGTFRQLQFDEEVHGPGGKMVTLPQGTFVQIMNWSRHRSKKLWGPDSHVFNPDRHFQENECWGEHGAGTPFAATNPASKRFSPFTFAPRDCLGKNFAQLEMRAILANVFRRWSFTCSEPYKNPKVPIEVMLGTMGPRDLTPEGLKVNAERFAEGRGPTLGMFLHLHPREKRNTPPSPSRL